MRQNQTPAEARLWSAVRGGRLDGLKFRRQYRIDRYVADFACEALMMIVELDGGVHNDDEQALTDQLRQDDLERLGWSVLRFANADVMGRLPDVLEAIRRHVILARA
ncbi:MAG: endonuclease domain-containing protein [Brevundimonas sp.]|nr:MAG: endonuclease domain-containing protein [Brevundimonas sp.]